MEPPATVAERRTSFNDDDDEYWNDDIDHNTSFDDDQYLGDEKFDNDSEDNEFAEQPVMQNKPLPPVPPMKKQYKFEALYDFDSSGYGEGYLSFNAGDQFYSGSTTPFEDWLTVTRGMSTGKVPFNYVKECAD